MHRSARLAAVTLALVLVVHLRPAAAQPRQVSVLLAPGWNNIAYVGPPRSVAVALAGLAGRYESVWTWDASAQRWLGLNPLMPAAGDFAELRQNQAYWLKMSAPGELVMDVPPAQPPVLLAPGWNNFVYPGAERPVPDALAPAAGRWTSVWRWDAARQLWNGFNPLAPIVSDFQSLGPHRPYFVRLADGPPVALMPALAPAVLPAAPTPTAPSAAGFAPLPPLPASVTPVPSPPAGPGQSPSPPTLTSTMASPTTTPTPTPAPAAARRGCYSFQSYQPQIVEVSRAQARAGFGRLTTDTDYAIKDLETDTDGGGAVVPAYIPPTLLKAIGWIESGWRQATAATARGMVGTTITSSSCAYGLMQVLTGMDIGAVPTPKQQKTGTDYLSNIAAGAQLLGVKWNLAPEHVPAVLPRDPRLLEAWYYAVWAYHCYGEVCQALSIYNNPDDPGLTWPRPMYNSPDQLASGGQFTFSDYPYQELVYGVVAYPPRVNNQPLWAPLPVKLPPRGTVGFPEPGPFAAAGATLDPTTVDGP